MNRKILLPLPPVDEQVAIANALASLDGPIESNEGAISQMRKVKRGLMFVLLTGEVRVTVDAGSEEAT